MFIENTEQNLIKINFDAQKEEIFFADMLKIASAGTNGVIAQVIKIESLRQKSEYNTATAKILFTVLNSGRLSSWQGNVPGRDFKLSMLEPEEVLAISNLHSVETPVSIGQMSLFPGKFINVEADEFKKPSIVVGDVESAKNEYLKYLAGELSEKVARVVIADRDGSFTELENAIVVKAGTDVKLPLDIKGLENLYNKTLAKVSPETRACIENIFSELEEYLLTENATHIPFSFFLEAIISEYEELGTPELSFLSNNIKKLYRKGIFADSRKEINKVFNSFMHKGIIVLDLSDVEAEWKEDFVEAVVDLNREIFKRKFFLFNTINSDGLAEKLLSQGLKSGISPIFSMQHESTVIDGILPRVDNIIALSAFRKSRIAGVEDFMQRLGPSEAIIYGKITNNVPLLISISPLDKAYPEVIIDQTFAQGKAQVTTQIKTEQPLTSELELIEEVEEDAEEIAAALEEAAVIEEQLEEQHEEISEEQIEEEEELAIEEDEDVLEEYKEELISEEPEEEAEFEEYEEETAENQEIEITSEMQMYLENEEEPEEEVYSEEEIGEYYEEGEKSEEEIEEFEEEEQGYFEEEAEESLEEEYEEEAEEQIFLGPTTTTEDTSGMSEEDKNMLLFLDEQALGQDSDADYEDAGIRYEEVGEEDDESAEFEEEDEGDEDFDYGSSEEFQDESVLEYINSDTEQEYEEGAEYEEEYTEEGYEEEDLEGQELEQQQEFTEEDLNNFVDLEDEEEQVYEEEQQEEAESVELSEDYNEEEIKMPGPPTTELPVYRTPDPISERTSPDNEIFFKEGDTVRHKKYGVGEVKKIIGYSERRLCSIQFVEVGRRLLDPKLAELELVNKI